MKKILLWHNIFSIQHNIFTRCLDISATTTYFYLVLTVVFILSRDGVWLQMGFGLLIGFIEHFNAWLLTTLHRPLSHTDWCSQSVFTARLVTSSNSGHSSASLLTSWQADGHLTPTSYSSNCHLKALSRLLSRLSAWTHNGIWFLFYSLNTGSTENIVSNSSSAVVCMPVAAITWRLLSRYLPTPVFVELFHNNSCLCWLNNSCFEQICHNILTCSTELILYHERSMEYKWILFSSIHF
jgi:hypothetical protein